MNVIYKEQFEARREEVIKAILAGKVFIYPTDTIYGIGCDASNEKAVKRVRRLKQRPDDNPLSVIAPSREWILQNCIANEVNLEKLPGPVTLIFQLRGEDAVASSINMRDQTLGVREPAHWFTRVIQEAGVPFVTTSVNATGEKFMTNLAKVPEEILNGVDFVIYEGEKKGSPSLKIRLTR